MNHEDIGHWEYPGDFNPDDWLGFVYRIIDRTNGVQYIGKKQFWMTRRVKVKGRKNRKVTKKESDWKTYTSSSSHVNNAINEKGKENFTFLIESFHETKSSLHYAEIEFQVMEDVLRATMHDGTKSFYNKMIGNVKFIPPKESEKESNMRISRNTVTKSDNSGNIFLNEMTKKNKETWKKKYLIESKSKKQ